MATVTATLVTSRRPTNRPTPRSTRTSPKRSDRCLRGVPQVLVDDADGLLGTLVEEEMTAPVEGTQPRAGDLLREDARILERDHHVVRAMHHQRRDAH